jgi:hypothetical protein
MTCVLVAMVLDENADVNQFDEQSMRGMDTNEYIRDSDGNQMHINP